MKTVFCLILLLAVSYSTAQTRVGSGTSLRVDGYVTLSDSLRLKAQGVTEFLASQAWRDSVTAIQARVICPPTGWTRAQVDSAARWGLNQPIDTCYYKNQLGQVFKYGRLP